MKISFSFIIPHRPDDDISNTINTINKVCRKCDINYEIISATGNSPSVQRNNCIQRAKNEYIYFLDNDSFITRESIINCVRCISANPSVKIFGGPNIAPLTDNRLQKSFNAVLTSFFCVGKISSRYSKRGKRRITDDSELILSALIIKKDVFESVGYFNERLYPNEENEFMYRIKKSGMEMIYDPDCYVLKSHRKNISGFIKQIFTYGRGRGEQTKLSPASFRLPLLFPPLFLIYIFFIIGVIFLITIGKLPEIKFARICQKNINFFYPALYISSIIPGLLYFAILFLSFAQNAIKEKQIHILYPFLFIITHAVYGAGLIYSLFKKGFMSDNKFPFLKIEYKKFS